VRNGKEHTVLDGRLDFRRWTTGSIRWPITRCISISQKGIRIASERAG